MSSLSCDTSGDVTPWTDLHIAPIFIIWFTGTLSAAFPILAYHSSVARVPRTLFEFTKYLGSGVIIATAFIHLLPPAINELTSLCLGTAWNTHPYPLMLTFLMFFTICVFGILAFHVGMGKLMRLGIHYDPYGFRMGAFIAHYREADSSPALTFSDDDSELEKTENGNDFEAGYKQASLAPNENAMARLIAVAVLEFGIILHSTLIGLTLAMDNRWRVLFVAVIFYQMFDGLALGSRLAYLDLPHKYRTVPFLGVFLYGITTPIGITMGLHARMIYIPGSAHVSFVSGILGTLSASILLYTGFVELLAQEFLFSPRPTDSPEIRETNIWKLLYVLTCVLLGYGAVILLCKWV